MVVYVVHISKIGAVRYLTRHEFLRLVDLLGDLSRFWFEIKEA